MDSADEAGNSEPVTNITFGIDNTKPSVSLQTWKPALNNAVYINSMSQISITGEDKGTVASGVDQYLYSIDDGYWQFANKGIIALYTTNTNIERNYGDSLSTNIDLIPTLTAGEHTINYCTIDNVGNQSVEKSITIYLDTTPPVINLRSRTGMLFTNGNNLALQSGDAIQLDAYDPSVSGVTSGINSIQYQFNQDSFITYTGEGIELPTGGSENTFTYRAIDNAGNTNQATVVIQTIGDPPSTGIVFKGPYLIDAKNSCYYASKSTKLTFSITNDSTNFINNTYYKINRSGMNSDYLQYNNPVSLTSLDDGDYSVSYYSIDNFGNQESTNQIRLKMDSTPPSSVFIPYTNNNPVEFYVDQNGFAYINGIVELRAFAIDQASNGVSTGVSNTYYQMGLSNTSQGAAELLYTKPLQFDDGMNFILYRSVDRLGNSELFNPLMLVVDKNPPKLYCALVDGFLTNASISNQAIVSPNGMINLYGIDSEISNTVTALTDAAGVITVSTNYNGSTGSGVKNILYSINGGIWYEYNSGLSLKAYSGQTIQLSYKGMDNVGNVAEMRTISIEVNNKPPSTLITFNGPTFTSNTLYIAPATSIILTNNKSGITLNYSLFNNFPGVVQTVPSPFMTNLSSEGNYSIFWNGIDSLGNEEEQKGPISFRLDATAPVVSINIDGASNYINQKVFVSSNSIIHLNAVDETSGVNSVTYSLNNGQSSFYSGGIKLNLEGLNSLSYQVIDNVSNIASGNMNLYLDDRAPVTTVSTDNLSFNGIEYIATSSIILTPSDNGSGIASVYYSVDNGGWINKEYQGNDITVSLDSLSTERHTIHYYSIDKAGNQEAVKSFVFRKMNTLPVVSFVLNGNTCYDAGQFEYFMKGTADGVFSFDSTKGNLVYSTTGDNNYIPYQDNISLSGDTFIQYQLTNGNDVVESGTITVKLDQEAPAINKVNMNGKPAIDGNNWSTENAVFSIDALDSGCGVSNITIQINQNGWQPLTDGNTSLVLPSDNNMIRIKVVDRLGNTAEKDINVSKDLSYPQVLINAFGIVYDSGNRKYCSQETVFSLNANDYQSGLSNLSVTVDGVPSEFVNNIGFNHQGYHKIEFIATDNAGNYNKGIYETYLDSAEPDSYLYGISQDGSRFSLTNGAYINNNFKFQIDGDDTDSGIKAYQYSLDGINWINSTPLFQLSGLISGPTNIFYRAIDNVNNSGLYKSVAVNVKLSYPETFLVIHGTTVTNNNGIFADIGNTYQFIANDSDSSSKNQTYINVDNNGYIQVSSIDNVQLNTNGNHTFYFKTVDAAGNWETEKQFIFNIDQTPPYSLIALSNNYHYNSGHEMYFTGDAPVSVDKDTLFTISAYENGSGLMKSLVMFGSTTNDYTGPFKLTGLADGVYAINFRSIDKLGNLEETRNIVVSLDNFAPVVNNFKINPSVVYPSLNNMNTAEITFDLSKDSYLNLSVYDTVSGNKVRSIVSKSFSYNGAKNYIWDGKDDNGRTVLSGSYIIIVSSIDIMGKEGNQANALVTIKNEVPPVFISSVEVTNNYLSTVNNASAGVRFNVSGQKSRYLSNLRIDIMQNNSFITTLQQYTNLDPGWYQVSWNGTANSQNLSEGEYTIVFSGRDDLSQNIASVKTKVTIDNTSPVIRSITAYPQHITTFVRGTNTASTLTYYVDDTLSPSMKSRLTVIAPDGRAVRDIKNNNCSAGYNTLTWDGFDNSGILAGEGVYKATVIVSDLAGNTVTNRVDITVDNTQPLISLFTLSNQLFSPNFPSGDGVKDNAYFIYSLNDNLDPNPMISITISDSNGNSVRNLLNQVYTKNGLITNNWDGRGENGAQLNDGSYHYNLTAHDFAGNLTESISGKILINTVPPADFTGLTVNPGMISPSNTDGTNDLTAISYSRSDTNSVSERIIGRMDTYDWKASAMGSQYPPQNIDLQLTANGQKASYTPQTVAVSLDVNGYTNYNTLQSTNLTITVNNANRSVISYPNASYNWSAWVHSWDQKSASDSQTFSVSKNQWWQPATSGTAVFSFPLPSGYYYTPGSRWSWSAPAPTASDRCYMDNWSDSITSTGITVTADWHLRETYFDYVSLSVTVSCYWEESASQYTNSSGNGLVNITNNIKSVGAISKGQFVNNDLSIFSGNISNNLGNLWQSNFNVYAYTTAVNDNNQPWTNTQQGFYTEYYNYNNQGKPYLVMVTNERSITWTNLSVNSNPYNNNALNFTNFTAIWSGLLALNQPGINNFDFQTGVGSGNVQIYMDNQLLTNFNERSSGGLFDNTYTYNNTRTNTSVPLKIVYHHISSVTNAFTAYFGKVYSFTNIINTPNVSIYAQGLSSAQLTKLGKVSELVSIPTDVLSNGNVILGCGTSNYTVYFSTNDQLQSRTGALSNLIVTNGFILTNWLAYAARNLSPWTQTYTYNISNTFATNTNDISLTKLASVSNMDVYITGIQNMKSTDLSDTNASMNIQQSYIINNTTNFDVNDLSQINNTTYNSKVFRFTTDGGKSWSNYSIASQKLNTNYSLYGSDQYYVPVNDFAVSWPADTVNYKFSNYTIAGYNLNTTNSNDNISLQLLKGSFDSISTDQNGYIQYWNTQFTTNNFNPDYVMVHLQTNQNTMSAWPGAQSPLDGTIEKKGNVVALGASDSPIAVNILSDGNYTVPANVRITSWTVNLENQNPQNPSVTLLTPVTNVPNFLIQVGGQVVVTNLRIYSLLQPGSYTNNWSGTNAWGLAVPDGVYSYKAYVMDEAGNHTERTIPIEVDNTPPAVKIVSPVNGNNVTFGTVNLIKVLVNDKNISSYKVEYQDPNSGDWVTITTGYGNVNSDVIGVWDVSSLPNGAYTLRLSALDSTGNSASEQIAVNVTGGTGSPISVNNQGIEVISPNQDGVNDVFTVNYNIKQITTVPYSHISMALSVTAEGDSTVIRSITGEALTGDNQNIVWDGKDQNGQTVEDGLYQVALTVNALYSTGDSVDGTCVTLVKVDRTNPDISIQTPIENAIVRNSFSITGKISDLNLQNYSLNLLDNNRNLLAVIATGSIPVTNNNAVIGVYDGSLSDGQYQLSLKAVDQGSNTSTVYRTILVDSSVPSVEINTPVDGGLYSSAFNVTGSVFDSNMKEWDLSVGPDSTHLILITSGNDNRINSVLGNINTSVWYNGMTSGNLIIQLTAKDKADRTTVVQKTISINNQVPVVTLTQPVNNSFVSGIVNIVGSMMGNYLSAYSLQVKDSSGNWQTIINKNNSKVITNGNIDSFNSSSLSDGTYTFKFSVLDMTGNIASSYFTLNVINILPIVRIEKPLINQLCGNSIEINGSVSGSYLKSYTIMVKDALRADDPWQILQTGSTNASGVLSEWNTSGMNGLYTIRISATDLAGNNSEASRSVIIDTTSPVINLQSPSVNQLVRNTISLTGSINDSHPTAYTVGLKGDSDVNYTVIGNGVSTNTQNITLLPNLDTTAMSDGFYEFQILAQDGASNSASASRRFGVDNTWPEVTLLTVQSNGYYRGTIPVNGQIIENNFASGFVSYKDNKAPAGTPWIAIGAIDSLNYSLNFNTGSLNGAYTIKVDVWDIVGHTNTLLVPVNIDNTAPIVRITSINTNIFDPNMASFRMTYQFNKTCKTDIKVRDAAGNIVQMWSTDYTNAGTYTFLWNGKDINGNAVPAGYKTVTVESVDQIGNSGSDSTTVFVYIDETAPVTVSQIIGKTINHNDILTGTSGLMIALSASDEYSGVAGTYYSINDETPVLYSGNIVLNNDGLNKIMYWSIDNAGNKETNNIISVVIDNMPPAVTLTVGSPLSDSYISSSTPIRLSASDTSSGVSRIEYNAAGEWLNYQSPFTVTSANNDVTIRYRATDNLGNTGGEKTNYFVLDNVAPVVQLVVTGNNYHNGNSYTLGTGAEIVVKASDIDGSGVNSLSYKLNFSDYITVYTDQVDLNIEQLAPGDYNLIVKAMDQLGNSLLTTNLLTIIPTTPPSSSLTVKNGIYIGALTNYLNTNSIIFVKSGAGNTREYRIDDDSVYRDAANGITIPNDGRLHTLYYHSVDLNGVVETDKSSQFLVDDGVPLALITFTGATYTNQFNRLFTVSGSQIQFNTYDPTNNFGICSGLISSSYYIVNNDQTINIKGSYQMTNILLTQSGNYNISLSALDLAGNVNNRYTTLVVDAQSPVSTLMLNGQAITGFPINGSADSLTLTADDGIWGSGVKRIEYTINNGSINSYSNQSISGFAAGTNKIKYRSIDNIGNTEAWQEYSIYFDNIPPATTISLNGPSYQEPDEKAVRVNYTTTLSLSAKDGAVAVDYTEYSINSGLWTKYYGPISLYEYSVSLNDIKFRSMDTSGNLETNNVFQFNIDLNGPVVSAMSATPNPFSPYGVGLQVNYQLDKSAYVTARLYDQNNNVIKVLALDNLFTKGSNNFTWNGYNNDGSIAAEGIYTVKMSIYDRFLNPGNDASVSARLIYDNNPPVSALICSNLMPVINGTAYVKTNSTFTVTAMDDLTGIANLMVDLDGAGFNDMLQAGTSNGLTMAYSKPIVILQNGIHTLQYYSIDNAGNMEMTNMFTVFADGYGPVTFNDYNNSSNWINTDVHISFKTYDPTNQGVSSGVSSLDIIASGAMTGTNWVNGQNADMVFNTEGTTVVDSFAVDKTGNTGNTNRIIVMIDKAAPDIAILGVTNNQKSGYQTNQAKIDAKDSVSGLRQLTVFVTRNNQQVFGFDTNFTKVTNCHYELPALTNNGSYSINVTVSDSANNASYALYQFSIDTTPPDVPSNLRHLFDGQNVYLEWPPVTNSDIKGYSVYVDSLARYFTTKPYIVDHFVDGGIHQYAVKSVDDVNNFSALSSNETVNTANDFSFVHPSTNQAGYFSRHLWVEADDKANWNEQDLQQLYDLECGLKDNDDEAMKRMYSWAHKHKKNKNNDKAEIKLDLALSNSLVPINFDSIYNKKKTDKQTIKNVVNLKKWEEGNYVLRATKDLNNQVTKEDAFWFVIDNTAPKSFLTVNGKVLWNSWQADNSDWDWQHFDVNIPKESANHIKLTAVDPVVNGTSSGVNVTYYSLTGKNMNIYWRKYTGEEWNLPEGKYTLIVRSYDNSKFLWKNSQQVNKEPLKEYCITVGNFTNTYTAATNATGPSTISVSGVSDYQVITNEADIRYQAFNAVSMLCELDGNDLTNGLPAGEIKVSKEGKHKLRISAISETGEITVRDLQFTIIKVEPEMDDTLQVEFYNANLTGKINTIYPWFKVSNNGTKPIDLNKLRLRYYFTSDSNQNLQYECDHSGIQIFNGYREITASITGKFVHLAHPENKADYYLEISLKDSAGKLNPGDILYIQSRIHNKTWQDFNQYNDYSFCPDFTDYDDWDSVSAYYDESCIFGEEP